jgi:hypothetical protein
MPLNEWLVRKNSSRNKIFGLKNFTTANISVHLGNNF